MVGPKQYPSIVAYVEILLRSGMILYFLTFIMKVKSFSDDRIEVGFY